MSNWLIYGANGYTGTLIAKEAVSRGLRPVLAGRSQAVAEMATRLGLAHRIFGLHPRDAECKLPSDCNGKTSLRLGKGVGRPVIGHKLADQ